MALDTTISGDSAESYASLDYFQQYAASMGFSPSGDQAQQEGALRRSAMFLDTSWQWSGSRADEDQSLEFPRSGSQAIPRPIVNAQCELALQALAGADLFSAASARSIKSESVKIDGAVEEAFEYDGGVSGGGAARAFPVVDALVRRYALGLASASGSGGGGMVGINK